MIDRIRAAAGVALACALAAAAAQPPNKPDNDTDRLSYSLGYQMGQDLRTQQIGLREAALKQGIEDALSDTAPALDAAEMQSLLSGMKRGIREAQQRKRVEKLQAEREEAERRRREGAAYMANNAGKPEVVQTPSGLQYRVIGKGDGRRPRLGDRVRVNYRGTLIDGTVFDVSASDGLPSVFAVNRVLRGWTEALQMMREGDRWELVIPPDLAYGRRGVLADQTLVYDLELVNIEPSRTAVPPATAAPVEGRMPSAIGSPAQAQSARPGSAQE